MSHRKTRFIEFRKFVYKMYVNVNQVCMYANQDFNGKRLRKISNTSGS